MYVVILAGGEGKRLWPISNKNTPKPFVKLNDDFSLLQNTILRASKLHSINGIIIVSGEKYSQRVISECNKLRKVNKNICRIEILVEPESRDTSYAISYASLYIQQNYAPDSEILVLPSDHVIDKELAFQFAVKKARLLPREGKVTLFGIEPSRPETNYGYIQYNKHQVLKFIEKPDYLTAQQYIKSGEYLWNSGIIYCQANILLSEIDAYSRNVFTNTMNSLANSSVSYHGDYKMINIQKIECDTDGQSIDYAVLQKSDNINVVACDIGWNDVGNWNSVSQAMPKDLNGNNIKGDALLHDVSNCYVESNNKQIAVVGVSNLAIIETDNGILIINKQNASDIKKVFSVLK
ncbi:MAG: hypothetical protein DGJ47_000747 [Rickettsiaceae bacterium]